MFLMRLSTIYASQAESTFDFMQRQAFDRDRMQDLIQPAIRIPPTRYQILFCRFHGLNSVRYGLLTEVANPTREFLEPYCLVWVSAFSQLERTMPVATYHFRHKAI